MKKPKDKKGSAPRKTAPVEQAASVVDQEGSAAEAGATAPVTDAPPSEVQEAEAAGTHAAASAAASIEGEVAKPAIEAAAMNLTVTLDAAASAVLAKPEFVTLSFPWPPEIPNDVLKTASIVVKAKPERGRWRGGRHFTREETVLPLADLGFQEVNALTADADLIVTIRVPKPV